MNEQSDSAPDERLNNVLAEYLMALEESNLARAEELVERHPEFRAQIEQFAENKKLIDRIAGTRVRAPAGSDHPTQSQPGMVPPFVPPPVEQLQPRLSNLEIIELLRAQ